MPNRLKIAMDFGADELAREEPARGRLELGLAPRRSRAQPEGGRRARAVARPHQLQALRGVRLRRPHARSTRPSARRSSTAASTRPASARIDAALAQPTRSPRASCAPTSRRASSSRAAPSASTASASRTRPTRATWACARRRATRRAACCSPTRSTASTSRSSTRRASPAGDGEVRAQALQGRVALVVGEGRGEPRRLGRRERPRAAATGVVKVKNGAGAWELEIKYPEWGRYLRARDDKAGGHRAGRDALHRLAGLGRPRPEGAGRRRDACSPSRRTSPSTRPARR